MVLNNKNPTYPHKTPEEIVEICFIQIANLTKKINQVEQDSKDRDQNFYNILNGLKIDFVGHQEATDLHRGGLK